MSRKNQVLLKKERREITLPTLVEYYTTAKQVKGCSKKTLTGIKSNLGKFITFLKSRGHSLKRDEGRIADEWHK